MTISRAYNADPWRPSSTIYARIDDVVESPSRTMRAATFEASEDATSGSVIAKADRISPARSGTSQRLLLGGASRNARGLPYSPCRVPLQLKISGAIKRAAHDLAERCVLEVR